MVGYKKYSYRILIFTLLLNFSFSYGQSEMDTLKGKTLEELFDLYENTGKNEEKIKFIKAFVNVAKEDNNKKRIVAGYYILSYLYEDERVLFYSDSILSLTVQNPTKYFPAIAYRSKAIYYHNKGDLKEAINYYLLLNKSAKNEKNEQLVADSNYSLGTIKRVIGEYEDALRLYRENISYTKKNKNNKNYLLTMIALSNIFYELKEIDSANYYNKLGVSESIKLKDSSSYHHFSSNQGIIEFLKGNYSSAIDSLKRHMPYFESKNDLKNLSYVYYYLGKAHQKNENFLNAISLFKKTDSVFQIEKDVSPRIRDSYKSLISFYKNKKNYEKQLFYVNRLIKFDSVIYTNNLYLNRKIFKEYDIPKLKSEKKIILKKMKKDEIRFQRILILALILLLITICFSIYQNKKRKLYKKRFEEILNTNSDNTNNDNTNNNTEINIPKEIVNVVLEELKLFENLQKFTSTKITLSSLAKELNTNTNYLSKIINHHKGVSFSAYLSSLRIEYIIDKLKTNTNIRKFTIKAIAEEAGFNNSESFSKSFYKIKGIKPSYFMKELNNLK